MMPFGSAQSKPEPDPTPTEIVDERLRPGQMITNGRSMWEVQDMPEGPQGGACWALNIGTGYPLWLTLETVSLCRIVYPELGMVPA
jgi:hypothetical protein